ncbi:alpha/beta hydrolase domain-containing protein [Breoghania sp.]|uniref:alpha/beta hydrolase domain-containing protein n=1 Tax=Breoghania sp. TaxID=2065378 RepID=UPI0026161AB8|nr:alpha/beta hydrolase domain-containing protein [Breoghania sp.]MDJ0930073.1 alpha/beta hydrolase domain-containing protein [Breoghania sp.]
MPDNVRLYFITGTQHFANWSATPAEKTQTVYPNDPLSATPILRALFTDMKAWVADGTEPPASRYPNLTDGTLTPLADQVYPKIEGKPLAPKYNVLQVMDYSTQPPARGETYPEPVPTVDADDNPQGGVIQSRLAVPLGTYEGWNPRAKGYSAGELYTTNGTFIPFPAEATKTDSRKSLAEHYADKADYLAKVKAAAEDLVNDRLMLKEDVATTLKYAERDADSLGLK